MIYVEAKDARIGDAVCDMVGPGEALGVICGTSNDDGGYVTVRWDNRAYAMDVISHTSPAWLCWAIRRNDPTQEALPLEDTDKVDTSALPPGQLRGAPTAHHAGRLVLWPEQPAPAPFPWNTGA